MSAATDQPPPQGGDGQSWLTPQTADELRAELESVRAENERLKRERRLGLIWELPDKYKEKLPQADEHHLPILREEDDPKLHVNTEGDTHLLIEGDNYYSLLGLSYTHHQKVDVIYIDPPYNKDSQGKKTDFTYNDKIVSTDDPFRHAKWLSFMEKRLVLAWELLKRDGALFISIDDAEFAALRLLCDQLFGEQNFAGVIVWEGGRKNDATFLSIGHDYVLIYARDLAYLRRLKCRWRVPKPGVAEILEEVRRLHTEHGDDYEAATEALRAYLKPLKREVSKLNGAAQTILRHYPEVGQLFPELARPLSEVPGERYDRVDQRGAYNDDGDLSWHGGGGPRYDVLHPVTKLPVKVPSRGWGLAEPDDMQRLIDDDRVAFKKDHTLTPRKKLYLHETERTALSSVFYKKRDAGQAQLDQVMGQKNLFPFPKDVEVLKTLLRAALGDKKDGLILDFFAGSGSTGQAVLELNAEDAAEHRFILCTNNENNICRAVTYERIRKLLTGYKDEAGNDARLAGQLRFFTSGEGPIDLGSLPDGGQSRSDLKQAFRDQSLDMLRLRQDCFDEVAATGSYAIYRSARGLLGVLLKPMGRENFLTELKQEMDGTGLPAAVYVFSFTGNVEGTEYQKRLGERASLEPVPDELLETYRRLFHRRLYGGWQ